MINKYKETTVATKKKPTDSTLRNVRAANKRLTKLESLVKALMKRLDVLEKDCLGKRR